MKHQAKNQHYVPQFLLRRFANKDLRVHAFDKLKEVAFVSSVRNVAAEAHMYDFEIDGEAQSLELFLSEFEAHANKIVTRIVEAESLHILNTSDRRDLALFVAAQMQRVKDVRCKIKSTNKNIRSELNRRGVSEGEFFSEMSKDEVKRRGIAALQLVPDFAKYLRKKALVLMKAPAEAHFYISDNPVVKQNLLPPPQPFMSNLGLACFGVEVYLPISSRLCLAFLCERQIKLVRNSLRLGWDSQNYCDWKACHELVSAVDSGTPDQLDRENVLNLNSLQVMFSTRFIFSARPEFDLAKRMLKGDPKLKHPRELVIV